MVRAVGCWKKRKAEKKMKILPNSTSKHLICKELISQSLTGRPQRGQWQTHFWGRQTLCPFRTDSLGVTDYRSVCYVGSGKAWTPCVPVESTPQGSYTVSKETLYVTGH